MIARRRLYFSLLVALSLAAGLLACSSDADDQGQSGDVSFLEDATIMDAPLDAPLTPDINGESGCLDECTEDQICYRGVCYDFCESEADCDDELVCRDERCVPLDCEHIPCEEDQVCYRAVCYDFCESEADCDDEQACSQNRCVSPGCEEVHCDVGEVCYHGVCYTYCESDAGCDDEYICWENRCISPSCEDVRCDADKACFQGVCYTYCESDADCEEEFHCIDEQVCIDPCSDVECASDQACYRGVCYAICEVQDDCDSEDRCTQQRCAPLDCQGVQCRGDETCYRGVCYPYCDDEADCDDPEAMCDEQACVVPTCDDGIQNGEETGIDCGGPDCDPCDAGQGCNEASDCRSGVCEDNTCKAACDLPWGGTIDHGDAITAYEDDEVGCDENCAAEQRICDDGQLSGSFQFASCEAPCQECQLPWGGTINHGDSITAYEDDEVECDEDCSDEQRVCTDGQLSGTFQFPSCESPCDECQLPWGGTIDHGDSVTAYEDDEVECGEECSDEDRVCTDGQLSGSYEFQSCDAPCSDCDATTVQWEICHGPVDAADHGETDTVENQEDGFTGDAQVICDDGSWQVQTAECVPE